MAKKTREEMINEKQNAQMVIDDQHMEQGVHPRIGNWYAFVTVGPIYHGKVIAITATHYLMEEMSWVADTGRASEFVKDPQSALEVEYLGNGHGVPRAAETGFYSVPPGKLSTK